MCGSPIVWATSRQCWSCPHGVRLEIDDAEAFYAALAEIRGSRGAHWVHVLEEKWSIVLACLAVTVTLLWIFMAWGVPAIARLVALATPVELDEAIGIESLALMDNYFFKETALPEDRRAAIETCMNAAGNRR